MKTGKMSWWKKLPWMDAALNYSYWTTLTAKEKNMTAQIIETNNGYALLDKSDLTIGTYSRRRDAVRGAARRGFTIAA